MEDMIDHHAMAVMMAEMCTMKVVHPELITLCQNIIASQSAEIQMMQTWLQDWYGISYEPKMMGDMQVHLKMALAKFEEWFLKHIISHHAKVIKMAEGCLQQAYHGELISLCQNIIVTQSEEINRMQTWLCKWYEYVITGKIYKQDGWMQLKFNDRCRLTCQRLERSYW